jgi:FixJ family two-component response regulator
MKILLASVIFLTGCSDYVTALGHSAAAGAFDEVTTPDATKRLSALTATAAQEATKAARDEALNAVTTADLQRLIGASGAAANAQLVIFTEIFQGQLQKAVRLALDETFGAASMHEVDAFRERLVGAPLQQDLDTLIDSATPHLAAAVQDATKGAIVPLQTDVATVKQEADAEAAKLRSIVIGLGVCAGALLLLFVIILGLVMRTHQRVVTALLKKT